MACERLLRAFIAVAATVRALLPSSISLWMSWRFPTSSLKRIVRAQDKKTSGCGWILGQVFNIRAEYGVLADLALLSTIRVQRCAYQHSYRVVLHRRIKQVLDALIVDFQIRHLQLGCLVSPPQPKHTNLDFEGHVGVLVALDALEDGFAQAWDDAGLAVVAHHAVRLARPRLPVRCNSICQ